MVGQFWANYSPLFPIKIIIIIIFIIIFILYYYNNNFILALSNVVSNVIYTTECLFSGPDCPVIRNSPSFYKSDNRGIIVFIDIDIFINCNWVAVGFGPLSTAYTPRHYRFGLQRWNPVITAR